MSNPTYGDLRTATSIVARQRKIKDTDGPALLALVNELFPSLETWEREVIALMAYTVGEGSVMVPCMALHRTPAS
jgi:hypothetical protein